MNAGVGIIMAILVHGLDVMQSKCRQYLPVLFGLVYREQQVCCSGIVDTVHDGARFD